MSFLPMCRPPSPAPVPTRCESACLWWSSCVTVSSTLWPTMSAKRFCTSASSRSTDRSAQTKLTQLDSWVSHLLIWFFYPGPHFNIKAVFPGTKISIIRIRQLWDCYFENGKSVLDRKHCHYRWLHILAEMEQLFKSSRPRAGALTMWIFRGPKCILEGSLHKNYEKSLNLGGLLGP